MTDRTNRGRRPRAAVPPSPILETAPPELQPSAAPDLVCAFEYAGHRRCRMPRWEHHSAFCLLHAREEEQLLNSEEVGRELATLTGGFKTASDVNHVLGKLFTLRAQNRIGRRDAVVLTYMVQLLLQTLPTVRRETIDASGHDEWKALLNQMFGSKSKSAPNSGPAR